MIDDDRTMQLYGYTSNELSPHASKPIVAVCEECGKYRVLNKGKYTELCNPCSHLGRTCTPETREKLSEKAKLRCGDKSPNWKGGVTEWRIMFYSTPAYKNWRVSVFERDNYTCQMCDVRGGDLEAHHISPVRDHKNDLMLLDINNGITLCKDCHKSIGQKEDEYAERFNSIIEHGGEHYESTNNDMYAVRRVGLTHQPTR